MIRHDQRSSTPEDRADHAVSADAPLQRQLAYWKRQLAGMPAALELPADRPRPLSQSFNGATHAFELPAQLVEALTALGRQQGATLFMTLLAAFQTLLHRHTAQEDIVVGSPIAGRTEVEPLIGFFVNTLVLRSDLSGNPTFRELLGCVRETCLGAYAHQDLPFERLVEELQPTRDPGRPPLIQVMLVLQNAPMQPVPLDNGTAKIDLTMFLEELNDGLRGTIEYSTDLFNAATIERLAGHFQTLLEGIAATPDRRIAWLPLLSEPELGLLLGEWNHSATDYPRDACFSQLFEAQAQRTPDALAVTYQHNQLTYAALNARANQLAHHLRSLGVGPDTLVGLCAERSVEMIVGMLGILKAGGAYVPVDPNYPAERLRYMLEDAQVSVVLTARREGEGERGRGGEIGNFSPSPPLPLSPSVVDLLADWPMIAQQPTTNPERVVQGEHLAYIIYTSGSTGRPKGVQVMQRGLLNLCYGLRAYFDDPHVQHTGLITSISFDISVNQIFPTLLFGRTLHIVPDEVKLDSAALLRLLTDRHIQLLDGVPSYMQAVLQDLAPRRFATDLRYLLIGGEKLEHTLLDAIADQLGDGVAVVNIYGLTEITDINILGVLRPQERERVVTVGRPLQNNRIYLTSERGALQPVGVVGEVCVSGESVSRGYLGRPELTAEKFVPCPFEEGALMVRTGDLGRRLEDGRIVILGRGDSQVKVRGYRLELGEIEAVLRGYPGLREGVVVARQDRPGDTRLIAYIVPGDWRLEIGDSDADNLQSPISNLPQTLRAFLKQRLPDYMIPAAFVTLDELPRTPNGKIDRKALPAPAHTRPALDHAYIPPRSALEAELATIWEQVLEIEPVGIDDHFIDLGGHSLHATRIVARINQQFQLAATVRNLFELPTVAGLATTIGEERGLVASPIVPADRSGPLLASFAQQRLWFLDQWEPGNPAYNIPIAIRIAGPLDVGLLRLSLGVVAQRHETLRTTFTGADGQPAPVIAPIGAGGDDRAGDDRAVHEPPLQIIDLSGQPATERQAAAHQIAHEKARCRFDLARGPLLRTVLLRLGAQDHLLVLIMHHIISDDWSTGVLFRELGHLYAAYRADRAASLPELPIQYADYALWQRQWLQDDGDSAGSPLQQQLAYWKRQLAGMPAALELPADRPRPLSQSFDGATHAFELPAQLVEALTALGRQQGATLFMTLLAAFQTLLHRHTAQEDIVVGSPIAGRTRTEVEPLIGFFVNTLALRSDLSGNPTFRELLGRVRETCLGAYAHQDLPFERLVEELQPTRDPGRPPLIQVMLVLQNAPMQPLRLDGLTLAPLPLDNGTAKIDLTMFLEELNDGLRGTIEYSTHLFNATTIERLAGHFRTLLEGIVASPDRRIAWLPLLSEPELDLLLGEWNHSAADYPREACFSQLFEAQAQRIPDALAVTYQQHQLTYAALNARANQLAHHLRSLGVGPDTLVGLCAERSVEMIVGMLGILKAGGAYVPLDPNYPAERIQYMLEDSRAAVVLTVTAGTGEGERGRGGEQETRSSPPLPLSPSPSLPLSLVDLLADWPTISRQPTTNLERVVAGQQRAYVIYTSGSTGRPKGVQVMQRGLLNLCYGLRAYFDDPHVQHTGLITSISFDISVNQIFPTLLFGRTLHIVPDEVKLDSAALLRLLTDRHIQLLDAVPSHMQAVLQDLAPRRFATDLRYLLIGGEKLEHTLLDAIADQLGDGVAVVNIYGLTEITDINILGVLRPQERERVVTVGRPLQNNRIYLTSERGALQPVGVVGEVCVSGESVSRGYLGRPELTAEKFVPCPFEEGALMVRTGDLGRRLEDGRIVILGRGDSQVKVRGYRLELGEIEAVLRGYPGLREGVVVARQDRPGDTRLIAYIVPGDWRLEIGDSDADNLQSPISNLPQTLRAFLKQRLPDYMVPAAFVTLDELPRTPNGKIDRKALPAPGETPESIDRAYTAPRSPVETVLAGMWSNALELAQVGIDDNFFDLGGHSLNATRIVSRVRQAFQIDLTVRHLFATPTIASLAEHMTATETQPGRTDKIARALQRIRQMSATDRQRILQQKKGSGDV